MIGEPTANSSSYVDSCLCFIQPSTMDGNRSFI
jgi:hypothetical protein